MPTTTKPNADFERYAQQVQKRIKALRQERGLSQEDLMEYGLSLRNIQRIEKEGKAANLTLLTLYKLCQAFDVTPQELLGD